jgi:type VI secretion system protein ImpG
MDDSILHFYEQELTFIREMGQEFAAKYPKIAGRLLLEEDKCDDPFTERLIEAFAYNSARVHKKINDSLPEITEALLGILYPHYNAPVPSMTVVNFEPIVHNIPDTGLTIDRGTKLISKHIQGNACRFQTTMPITIWPLTVQQVKLTDSNKYIDQSPQTIEISLKTPGQPVSDLQLNKLCFALNAPDQHVYHLYELLLNNIYGIEIEAKNKDGQTEIIKLNSSAIQPVGFEPEQALLPYEERTFPGYNLLFEYFTFPEKFLFFDLTELDKLRKYELSDTMTIRLYLNKMAKSNMVINTDTFCLNSSPAINLFNKIAEPIRVEHTKNEYRVNPDIRRPNSTEIFSINEISSATAGTMQKTATYRPFYSIRHHLEQQNIKDDNVFWHYTRTFSGRKGDAGTDVSLAFTDLTLHPQSPSVEILTVRTTCTNRDLPRHMTIGNITGDFDLETAAPILRTRCMLKPTPTKRPFVGGDLQWRLISHLSLNYMSMVEGGEDALKEILSLYDFDNSASTRQQINGIRKIVSEHTTKRIGQSFSRGIKTTITLDEDNFVGSGLYLFGSILERFLGQYVSVNSFCQFAVKTLNMSEPLKQWPPRTGNKILL